MGNFYSTAALPCRGYVHSQSGKQNGAEKKNTYNSQTQKTKMDICTYYFKNFTLYFEEMGRQE